MRLLHRLCGVNLTPCYLKNRNYVGVYYNHWTVCHLFFLYVMISAEPSKFLSCSFNLILEVNIDQLLISLFKIELFLKPTANVVRPCSYTQLKSEKKYYF